MSFLQVSRFEKTIFDWDVTINLNFWPDNAIYIDIKYKSFLKLCSFTKYFGN